VVGSKAFVAALSALATGDKAPQQAVHLRNRDLAWTALPGMCFIVWPVFSSARCHHFREALDACSGV
jgi:hypothetical protein